LNLNSFFFKKGFEYENNLNLSNTRHFLINSLDISKLKSQSNKGFKFYGGDWRISETYDEMVKKGVGIERMGILRLDVDNLGKIFKEGFGRNATFARIVQLSSMLDFFFFHHINKIKEFSWDPKEELSEKLDEYEFKVKDLVEIVYSGGDDVASLFLQPKALLISSAFPFYINELFLPKPLNYFFAKNLKYDLNKKLKKLKFFSLNIVKKILNNEDLDLSLIDNKYFLDGCWRTIQNNSSEDKIYSTMEVPHIVTDRISYGTQIFYQTEVFFNSNAGLFFIADVKDELIQKFEAILNFLGDEGLGADKTIGKGLFEAEEIPDFNLNFNETENKSNFYYSLSLYSPTKEEFEKIASDESYYDFIIRAGLVSNKTLSRKNLRMFIEGSVLKFKECLKPYGEIKKVLNKEDYANYLDYDIYRSGQALFLPMKGVENENS